MPLLGELSDGAASGDLARIRARYRTETLFTGFHKRADPTGREERRLSLPGSGHDGLPLPQLTCLSCSRLASSGLIRSTSGQSRRDRLLQLVGKKIAIWGRSP